MELLYIAVLGSLIFVAINFVYFLVNGRKISNTNLFGIIEIWTVWLVPLLFLSFADLDEVNDCCTDSAVFSPEHRLGIYALMFLSAVAYLISMFKNQLLPPIAELLLNMFLITGLIINTLLCIHLQSEEMGPFFWLFGNAPILMLFLMKLAEHHVQHRTYIDENNIEITNLIGKWSLRILQLKPIIKYPALLLLLVPFVILISLFLILFGQKPDSLIRAFTDTYKHGFSQLDYMCENVQCGGHFLCSVGANGHKSIVKPIRFGERNGEKIICNRQLLIANAFEDLLYEHLPHVHRAIRKQYDKVGRFIHKYYSVFTIKLVSDIVYVLMKPLECTFLVVLYTFDRKPENRIAKQYLTRTHRQLIDGK